MNICECVCTVLNSAEDPVCVYFQVLAHRGNHWTLLRCVCQTVWDHSCRINVFSAQFAAPVAPDQLRDTLTSLLVLSADLIMDMMHRLGVMSTDSRHTHSRFLKMYVFLTINSFN